MFTYIPQFLFGIISVIPFVILWFITRIIFNKILSKSRPDSNHRILIFVSKTLKVIIWVIGTITMLSSWSIDISAIIAGLGLAGLTLGIALRDAVASSFTGVIILFYRPFVVNSRVLVMGVEGKVIDIDIYYTTIQNKEGRHLIPNSKLLTEKVLILDS